MKQFDVRVLYQEDIPNEIVSEFQSDLLSTELTVELNERPIGIYMALEWTIPAAFAVYLAKPYFDAFLSEAGKDHYAATKSALVRVIGRLFGTSPSRPARSRSLLFSVQVTTSNGENVKFVFVEGLDQQQYEANLTALDDLMIEHYASATGGRLEELIQKVGGNSRNHYLEYSDDLEQWIAIDTMAELKKQHDDQSD